MHSDINTSTALSTQQIIKTSTHQHNGINTSTQSSTHQHNPQHIDTNTTSSTHQHELKRKCLSTGFSRQIRNFLRSRSHPKVPSVCDLPRLCSGFSFREVKRSLKNDIWVIVSFATKILRKVSTSLDLKQKCPKLSNVQ
jgi:hypothetical protein